MAYRPYVQSFHFNIWRAEGKSQLMPKHMTTVATFCEVRQAVLVWIFFFFFFPYREPSQLPQDTVIISNGGYLVVQCQTKELQKQHICPKTISRLFVETVNLSIQQKHRVYVDVLQKCQQNHVAISTIQLKKNVLSCYSYTNHLLD